MTQRIYEHYHKLQSMAHSLGVIYYSTGNMGL